MLIICNGMKRAGSTLQYNLVSEIIETSGKGKRKGFFSPSDCREKMDLLIRWSKDPSWYVIKAHVIAPFEKLGDYEHCRIIYVFRDLRDVALSILNKGGDPRKIFRVIQKIINVDQRVRQYPGAFIQKYEELIQLRPETLTGIADNLNITIPQTAIEDMIHNNRITRVQENIKISVKGMSRIHRRINRLIRLVPRGLKRSTRKLGINSFIRRKILPRKLIPAGEFHSDHISSNKGEPGSWKTGLNHNIAEKITSQYHHWLETNQYLQPEK